MAERFFMFDVEADGDIPPYSSMLWIGGIVVGEPLSEMPTFEAELAPISDSFDQAALDANGLDREHFVKYGRNPVEVMHGLHAWVAGCCADGAKPKRSGRPVVYDGGWQHWYSIRFTGVDPFGHNGFDLQSYAMGRLGCSWEEANFGRLALTAGVTRRFLHQPLPDAFEQAAVQLHLLKGRRKP